MKYGEVFYTTRYGNYWRESSNEKPIKCRFRIDPIPGRGKFHPYRVYWRYMKTTQERRLSFAYPEYTRARRNFRNLPDAYDDYYRSNITDKCWKRKKKKKQWM